MQSVRDTGAIHTLSGLHHRRAPSGDTKRWTTVLRRTTHMHLEKCAAQDVMLQNIIH